MSDDDEARLPSAHVGARSLRVLLDSVLIVGSDLDLPSMLRRIVEAAARLADARYAALGVLDEDGHHLSEFITVGIDDETHQAIGALPKGFGLLGSIIEQAEPMRLAELREHPDSVGFPPNHPPMQSFLGVPIRVKGKVFGNLYLTDKISAEVFTDIDEELVTGLAASAGVAIENARLFEQKARREATLAAIQEVATALLAGVNTEETLRVVAHRSRTLARSDVAAIALPSGHEGDLTIEIADGEGSAAIEGQRLPRGQSLSGEVLRTSSPVIVEDVSTDPRIHEVISGLGTLGPALFVPLFAEDQTIGTLMVARTSGSAPISSSEVDIVLSFASQASVVLAHERGRRQLQRLALVEDQERIGRDLHDTVIQRLFAAGLALQGTSLMVTAPEARQRLDAVIDELDVVIRHIRTVIFDVEPSPLGGDATVRRQALDVVRESGRGIGFEPRLVFSGPIDSAVDQRLAGEFLATLREALSNVARHARAASVLVEIDVGGDLSLRVSDDGVGVSSDDELGRGTQNMRQRAGARGGTMRLERRAEGGTTLEWRVPLTA